MELPYKGRCRITKLFGTPPPIGVTYRHGYHTGLDLVGMDNKNIYACEGGKVIASGFDSGGWGNYIKVLGTQSGLCAIYCHLSRRDVLAGEIVAATALIGCEGATGQVTGSHLHLEFRKDHTDGKTALDPCGVLGIKNLIGEAVKLEEFKTGQEVLTHWAKIELIDSPDYWLKALDIVKNLDKLLIKAANYYAKQNPS